MPELPEVETIRRGITPHIQGKIIREVIVRQPRLRWPVPADLAEQLCGHPVEQIDRRSKYLLLRLSGGTLIMHLGMSGSLHILPADTPPKRHDHLDLRFGTHCLRLHDPRRFGAVLWHDATAEEHPLLAKLGPEPLQQAFNADYLYEATRERSVAVKNLLMNSRIVVGVGNIYASESLFCARIHPAQPAGKISKRRCSRLVDCVKQVLEQAIAQGGTSLRDFTREDGRPGYFAQQLQVYGRTDAACRCCATPIRRIQLGQRSSYLCPHCQPLSTA
jgi:formamidopyrimidine-DNA glycosylase